MRTEKAIGIVAGALALVLGVASGVQTWRLHSERTAHAEAVARYESRLGAAERRAREAMTRNDALEEKLKVEAASNATNLETERKKVAAARSELAGVRVDNDRLRDSIARFAAGSREPAEDSVHACRERATELGVLLDAALREGEETLRVGGQSAVDAEGLAADVRALLVDGRNVRAAVNAASSYTPAP